MVSFNLEDMKAKVKNGAAKVTDADFNKVIEKSEEIKQKIQSGGPLDKYIDDIKILIAMVKDYKNGIYKEIPYFSIAAIVFSLLYIFNPFDILPDVIPILGLLDDAAVMAASLQLIEQDIYNYKKWKEIDE